MSKNKNKYVTYYRYKDNIIYGKYNISLMSNVNLYINQYWIGYNVINNLKSDAYCLF